jgi:hypothetical protein
MDLQKLLYSFLCLIACLLFYKYEKWSIKKKKEKWGNSYSYNLYSNAQGWGLIILALIMALVFFLEAIHLMK